MLVNFSRAYGSGGRLLRFAAPAICAVKYFRGTIIHWRGKRWRITDRKWDRYQKEWDYSITSVEYKEPL
jgi:hypothetical protein